MLLRFRDILSFLPSLLGYINNSSFPLPLSEEEESDCLTRLASGDMEARNLLIERNLRLVAHVVKKFESTGLDRDDLISIGTIGLIKAVGSFSTDKGSRFATYAARCIENEILMHLRASKNKKSEVSMNEPVGTDKEGNELALIDLLVADNMDIGEMVELEEHRALLYSRLSDLPDLEREVVVLRHGLGNYPVLTQREIASLLGISRSYVSRIEKRAVAKLFKAFEKFS